MLWNCIIQLPADCDHIFMYGLIKDILTACMKSIEGVSARKKKANLDLDCRLQAFDYPIGWEPFTFHMLRTVNARHSMELFRRAGTVCIHIFRGIYLCDAMIESRACLLIVCLHLFIYLFACIRRIFNIIRISSFFI